MSEDTPIRLDEILGRERALGQIYHANTILNGLLALQLPIDQGRANELLSRSVITLQEYAKIQNAQSEQELSGVPGAHKILMRIRTQRALLREFGAALVNRGCAEGIPITLATRTFLDDDLQDSIAKNSAFDDEAAPLLDAAFAFEEEGGMIVFPAFESGFSHISFNVSPDNARVWLDRYTDNALSDLVKAQSTPVAIATEMIRLGKKY